MANSSLWPFNDGVLFFSDSDVDFKKPFFRLDGGDGYVFCAKSIGECHTNCKIEDDGVIRVSCNWYENGHLPPSMPLMARYGVFTMKYTDHLGKAVRKHNDESDMDDLDTDASEKRKVSCEKQASSQKPQDLTRKCALCDKVMVQGTDVSGLFCYSDHKLFCSSRNPNWAFHFYHTSCLVHWILQSEYDIWINVPTEKPTPKRGPGRPRLNKETNFISCAYCPSCFGTGKRSEGGKLEKVPVVPKAIQPPSLKEKRDKARKAWADTFDWDEDAPPGLQFKTDSSKNVKEEDFGKRILFYRGDPDKVEKIVKASEAGND